MKLNKALFYLSVLCISTALANYRHFPDRSQIFSEERHSHFLRNLADDSINSHNKSSSGNNIDPVTVRLKGNTELGYYYVTLFFGTPLQKQTLIVDTGSVTTTIPCTECGDDCGKHHFDRPFNHNKSESFEEFKCSESFGGYSCYDCDNKCPFSVSYVEGSSYSGHFNKDFVAFGNEIEDNFAVLSKKDNSAGSNTDAEAAEEQARQIVNNIVDQRKIFMPFGCTNRETKLFYDQEADGILGLGVHTNTQSSPPNLLDALKMRKSEASTAFSLCLAQDGGYFTVGGHNEAYHAPGEKIQYTRYSDAFNQYKVTINKIEVNGQNIGLKVAELNSGEGAFFDSGTTLTHVPSKTYNGIRNYLRNHCGSGGKACGKGAESGPATFCWRYQSLDFASVDDFFATFPTIKFYFGRDETDLAGYDWKPEDYLYEKDEKQKVYCLGLSHYERESILGGTFMKNHDVLFDKQNKRVGFIRANCNGVQEVTAPVFVQNNRSSEVTPEPKGEVTQGVPGSESHPAEKHALQAAFVMCLIGAVAAIVVGLGIFVYRICRKKSPYQNMRNLRIEIPSAGLSIHRLDSSGVDTPKVENQPVQENNADTIDEGVVEESNPEIQIDVNDT